MKKPKYFCEHCGAEVGRNARVCPRCGRFFSSVKCPKCGFVGVADDFLSGCPSCGYAEAANDAPEAWRPAPEAAPPLPIWVWLGALGLTILVLFLLLRAVAI